MVREAAQASDRPRSVEARDSMARHGIPDGPHNFWVWHTYHSGTNPDLNRAIDILVSNHREFTDQTNEEIFELFFGTTREHEIIRETTDRVSAALDALVRFINEASAGAGSSSKTLKGLAKEVVAGKPLTELLGTLMTETKSIEEHSLLLHERLISSSATIDQLRKNFDDAQRDALTDGLTGISNRKLFDSTLRQAVMQAMETGADLSLLLIDIDHFKLFNDTWGHQTGDEVLRLVATSLAADLREVDTPARYGGEEFAAILPGADLDAAIFVGNRIRTSLKARGFVDRKTGKDVGTITVSIGAALFQPGESLTLFISRADSGLYAAKHQGRNRVVAA